MNLSKDLSHLHLNRVNKSQGIGEESESGTPRNKERKNMAELRDEHFEVISENKARRYEIDKKELQHKVMDLELTIHKISKVIEEHENSNNNGINRFRN